LKFEQRQKYTLKASWAKVKLDVFLDVGRIIGNFFADRTICRAFGTLCRLSVCVGWQRRDEVGLEGGRHYGPLPWAAKTVTLPCEMSQVLKNSHVSELSEINCHATLNKLKDLLKKYSFTDVSNMLLTDEKTLTVATLKTHGITD